jgi:Deoxyribonuclease NucA/NucB
MSTDRTEGRGHRGRAAVAIALTAFVPAVATAFFGAPVYAAVSPAGAVTPQQIAKVSAMRKNAACAAGTRTAAGKIVCTSAGKVSRADRARLAKSRPAKPRTKAGPADAITLPPQCTLPISDPGGDLQWPDRLTTCASVYWQIAHYQVVDGTPVQVGQLDFTSDQSAEYSTLIADPSWFHTAILTVYVAWGDMADTLVAINSNCTINTTVCKTNGALLPDPNEFEMLLGSTWSNKWSETDLGVQTSNASFLEGEIAIDLGFSFQTITDDGSQLDIPIIDATNIGPGLRGLRGRCDSIMVSPRGRQDPGCVNDRFTPTVNFDATADARVQEVAQHVQLAQRSIPEHFGVPISTAVTAGQLTAFALHRDTSEADRKANNAVACANVQPPLGYNCDEYPMASTYEGAAFQPHWSSDAVPQIANSVQGNMLATFYWMNRVIDGDPYYVQATLQDGTRSWIWIPSDGG